MKSTYLNIMKIIFFGTPKFAAPSLEKLTKSGDFEIMAAVTQEDKPIGRKQVLTPTSIKIKAKELGLKVLQPKNSKELEKELSKYKADFFVVIAYGEIMSEKILKMPKYGSVNVHASMLPKYRGASPIQESLLNGDKETGISIIKIDNKMDHGDIYLIKRIKIEKNDTLESLSKKLAKVSAYILPLALKDIAGKTLSPLHQDDKKATYCRKIKKEDGKIDFKEHSAEDILNMIKAYTPWPSVFTEIKGKKIKIIEAKSIPDFLPPGKIAVEGKILKIGTLKGTLIPTKIQPEGKNKMDISAFLNGYRNLFLATNPDKSGK